MNVHEKIEHVHIRREAMKLVQKHWLLLVVMTAIVSGVSWLLSIGLQWVVDRVVGTPETPSVLNGMTAPENVNALMRGLLMLLTFPLPLALGAGRTAAILDMARGVVASPKERLLGMLAWMKRCLKCAALALWMLLWLFMWGLAMMGILLAAGILSSIFEPLATLLSVLAVTGALLLLAWVLLRYSLALLALADSPDRGAADCLNESKLLMSGHIWRYIRLQGPCIGVWVLLGLGASLLTGAANTLLSLGTADSDALFTELMQLLSLGMGVFIQCVAAVYYDRRMKVRTRYSTLRPAASSLSDDREA